ncbi:Interferon-induced GTP-binding protein Mx2 [Camelus dromedarius]|uniref:Interferon-induced GTP-binding protein Mx2 n=1 Tax=Camelus dromedarius TaxID=9838 RepID=A0A5N4EJN9_CAMDR|nr:Interferon-induced GTP-binding protein Mx2 [Camelus dromedarius]
MPLVKAATQFENQYRGRELRVCVNYKTFETIIKSKVEILEEPAVDMLHRVTELQSKVEDIKLDLENEAEKVIRLHFQMEQIVYCQDKVYRGALQKAREKEAEEEKNKKSKHSISTLTEDPSIAEVVQHLTAYHEKSLPLLENQTKESQQRAIEELRQCGANVPSHDADKMFFLIEKIKAFNQDIEKLIEGEEVVKEKETRLYNKIREEFKNWVLTLAANTQKVKNVIHEEVSRYEKQYRGKELLGFVNYRTFETIVKQYLERLVDPAVVMLQKVVETVWHTFTDTARKHFSEFSNLSQTAQNKIEDIKSQQAERAERFIRLQFKMEHLVYCQDQIYSVVLSTVREEIFNSVGKPSQNLQLKSGSLNDPSSVSSITEIGVHLNAYFLETSKRLSNQIPLIIQYFMLQENGDHVQKAMLQTLQEKQQYSWLLQEQSDTSAKRRVLKEKIHRLDQARRALYQFSL